MSNRPGRLLIDRELSPAERQLIQWMLVHGKPEAAPYFGQLNRARVHSQCRCGCASIDLSIDGARPKDLRKQILSAFQWRTESGALFGAFVFGQDGLLAGLDLWSQDGRAIPSHLPEPEELRPA